MVLLISKKNFRGGQFTGYTKIELCQDKYIESELLIDIQSNVEHYRMNQI